MARPPRRPAPRSVGPVRLRVIRGPHPRDERRWYWRAERYARGGTETLWTGWGTVEDADQAVAALVAGVVTPTQADVTTVRDLLSLWHGTIEHRADLAPATIDSYGNAAVRLSTILGAVPIERLDRGALERYRDQTLRLGRAARSVETDLKILRQAWRWGTELALVPLRVLPAVRVHLPELHHPRPTGEQVAQVLTQLRGPSRLHLLLLWSTGCRVSEIGSLRRRDVRESPTRMWLTVVGKRRSRQVPLPDTAADALRAWMALHPGPEEGWVLGRTPGSARELLHLHLKAAGAPWTPHDLRRAAVDQLYRRGIDVGTAAAMLGHSPAVALKHYRRAVEADLEAALTTSGLGAVPELPAPAREAEASGGAIVRLDVVRRGRRRPAQPPAQGPGKPPLE